MKYTSNRMGIILPLIAFLSGSVQAQKNNPLITHYYLQGSAGLANHKGLTTKLGSQLIVRNKWATTLSYQVLETEPGNLPDDYTPAVINSWFFGSYEDMPDRIKLNHTSITGGPYFKLKRNCWATIEAGISFVNGKKYRFEKKSVPSGYSTFPNYKETLENKSAVGAVLKSDINFSFFEYMGMGIGVFANLNSIQSSYGWNISLLIGKLPWSKKQKR
jgi:hypothetical protein